MKTLDPAMRAALYSDNVTLFNAVYIDVADDQKVRVHNSVGQYTIDGEVFDGIGDLGSIQNISKDGSTSPEGIKLTVNGLDPTLLGDVMLDGYQGRDCVVYLCILANGHQDLHHHIIFKGRLDTMTIALGETAMVEVNAENRLVTWSRGNTTRWNQASHKRTLNPGVVDAFFEYVEETADKEIQFDPYVENLVYK